MYQGRYWSDRMFDVVEAVEAVAKEEGLTPAQVALAWLFSREAVTAPIVGASRPEHLVDCAAAAGRRLDGASLARLDEVSQAFR
jgi:aryl-alcohol dehydrogenase-like predicted oxidoreductase